MKWLKKFGKISYSFYLIHYIILDTVNSVVQRYDMNGILISLFVFSASIVAASIMYWVIELRLGKILSKRQVVISESTGDSKGSALP